MSAVRANNLHLASLALAAMLLAVAPAGAQDKIIFEDRFDNFRMVQLEGQ
jgi:hypothetical protein